MKKGDDFDLFIKLIIGYLVIVLIFLLASCDEYNKKDYSFKEFMVDYGKYEVIVDGNNWNKFHKGKVPRNCNEAIIELRGENNFSAETIISSKWKNFKGTDVWAKLDWQNLRFQVRKLESKYREPKLINKNADYEYETKALERGLEKLKALDKRLDKINKQLSKKEGGTNTMGFSTGTWIMIIIVSVIMTKLSNKLSLKAIFKPTKKAASEVKKEWTES